MAGQEYGKTMPTEDDRIPRKIHGRVNKCPAETTTGETRQSYKTGQQRKLPFHNVERPAQDSTDNSTQPFMVSLAQR
jgi:hypothetical protein